MAKLKPLHIYAAEEVVQQGTAEDIPVTSAAEVRYGPFFMAYLTLVCLLYVFVSRDTFLATPLTLRLYRLFMEQIGPLFSLMDMLFLGLAGMLLWKFRTSFSGGKRVLKFLFGFAVVCYLLNLLNPGDHSKHHILGLPLISEMSIYPYLFFFYIMSFMEKEAFLVFIRKACVILCVFVGIRSLLLLALWAMGMGNRNFFGVNSTLTEGDSLLIFAYFVVLSLSLLLIRFRFSVLLLFGLTMTVEVLSFRRTALIAALAACAGLLVVYFFRTGRGYRLVRNVVIAAFAAVLLYAGSSTIFSNDQVNYYITRYFGVFFGLGNQREGYASDSGHMKQSIETLTYAFEQGNFWGYGYGDLAGLSVPGATSGVFIHNVYAAVWLYEGVYMLLYYIALALLIIGAAVRLFFISSDTDLGYVLIMNGIALFLIMMMVTWYTNPVDIAENLRMRILWLTLAVFLFRVTPEDYAVLTGREETGADVEPAEVE